MAIKKVVLYIVLITLTVLCSFDVSAQKKSKKKSSNQYKEINIKKELHTESDLAIKYYEKGVQAYDRRQYIDAALNLEKAVEEDPNFIEAQLTLAETYRDLKKVDDAIEAYKKVLEIDTAFFPPTYSVLAKMELSIADYENAYKHASKFLELPMQREVLINDATFVQKTAEFGINALKKPVPFNPINLGPNVNSEFSEYLPAITADDSTLVFTVLFPKTANTINQGNKDEEDLYVAYKINGQWSTRIRLPEPLNSFGNEGAQCIAPDGQTIYYTACNREDGKGSCDIYMSKKQGNSWTVPINLGFPVNTGYWESQPTIASDGRTLYFISNRPGGFGDTDIWKTYLEDDGTWSLPVNLGSRINTAKSEMSPFIHPDNQTLYFSSSGHIGMGGYDLFYSRLKNDTVWGAPVNMGHPINTFAEEVNLIVSAKGDKAYFSSDREGGYGKQDLYVFDLYEEARPVTVTYMKGKVYDAVTKIPLSAGFEVVDLESGKVIVSSFSDAVTGEYLVSLPINRDYALNASKEGYLFFSESFNLKQKNDFTTYHKDVPLHKIDVGATVVLRNIFFETNRFELKEESKIELDKVLKLLNTNPTLSIELSGHTDNVGNAEHNKTLSTNRALAVYNYLIEKGIDKNRLKYAGYGATKPIDVNTTDEGRANNRRTEFKIIKK